MRKVIITIIVSLLLVQSVTALQQIAGPLVIPVSKGGSGTAQYGLVNDGNETITVTIRAEGDVANYLSFPKTVDLEPNKVVYTNITAKIPSNYNLTLGKNITGFVYALQEGKPGQVKINVQLKKSVTVTVLEEETKKSPMTGLVTFVSTNYIVIFSVVGVIVILIVFIKIKKRR